MNNLDQAIYCATFAPPFANDNSQKQLPILRLGRKVTQNGLAGLPSLQLFLASLIPELPNTLQGRGPQLDSGWPG